MKSAANFGNANIQAAKKSDVNELVQLDKWTNDTPWLDASWHAAILHDNVLVLKNQGKIAAFIVWQTVLDEAELHLIATHPDFRRQKFASQLLDYFFQAAKTQKITRILLEVRASNSAAQALYLRHGFQIIATRRAYYRNGEDALIMEKLC